MAFKAIKKLAEGAPEYLEVPVEEGLPDSAAAILRSLGYDMEEAIAIFLRRIIQTPLEPADKETAKLRISEIADEAFEQRRSELLPPQPKRKTGRAYRRMMNKRKFEHLFRIVTHGYHPHAGYVDWPYVGARWLPTGKYIKYPKNSNCQRWCKKASSARVRKYMELPSKGNSYRKVFDYWWTLY